MNMSMDKYRISSVRTSLIVFKFFLYAFFSSALFCLRFFFLNAGSIYLYWLFKTLTLLIEPTVVKIVSSKKQSNLQRNPKRHQNWFVFFSREMDSTAYFSGKKEKLTETGRKYAKIAEKWSELKNRQQMSCFSRN